MYTFRTFPVLIVSQQHGATHGATVGATSDSRQILRETNGHRFRLITGSGCTTSTLQNVSFVRPIQAPKRFPLVNVLEGAGIC